MQFNKKTGINLFWVSLYKILIETAYMMSISPNYTIFINDFKIINSIISWLLLLIGFIIVTKVKKKQVKRFSTIILYSVYLFSFIPGISLWSIANLGNNFIFYFSLYWITLFLLFLFYSYFEVRTIRIDLGEMLSNLLFMSVLSVFIIFGIYYSYKYSGLRLHFDITNVYDIRNSDNNASTLESMLYYISSTVVFPIFAIFFYKNKKVFLFLGMLFMQFLMFSVAGHKFYFYVIPVGVVAYHFYSSKFFDYIPQIMSMVAIMGIIEQVFLSSYRIIDIFIRRLLYLPSLLDYYYYDFFLFNEPIKFGQDMLLIRLGNKSPYTHRVSRIIGEIYLNGSNANTGMFGDSFSNLGEYAVIIYPIIFLVIMIILDLITSEIPLKYYITVFISIVIVLLNGEISGLIYHFIIPLSLLFIIMNYESEKDINDYNIIQ